jgi:hypothetical protein
MPVLSFDARQPPDVEHPGNALLARSYAARPTKGAARILLGFVTGFGGVSS